MKQKIPYPMISVISDTETHPTLDILFAYANAPDCPQLSELSKKKKASEWLKIINRDCEKPLTILGSILEGYMEAELSISPQSEREERTACFVNEMHDVLRKNGLRYLTGGYIISGSSVTSAPLKEIIKERNLPAVETEFTRALENLYMNPREAISAACNILESTFKIYITDEKMTLPIKQDLQSLWKVVRKSLGMDTQLIEDDDLKKILSGLYSITDGIGALRTHASSAHGSGKQIYNLKPRHARLAVNAAHTLTMFIIESWEEKKSRCKSP